MLATAFLAIRSVHVLQGATCLASGRSAYRRPRVAAAVEAAAAAELAALAVRCLRKGRYDPVAARSDAALGVAGLVALAAALEPGDRTASLNWMLPLSVGSCLGSATLDRVGEGAALSTALGATYAATTYGSIRQGGGGAATAVANALSYPGFFVVAALIASVARRMAEEVDEVRKEAVEQGARLAAEASRNREHRMLHDSALQTLEAVARGALATPEQVRRAAQREAAALRRALSGTGGRPDGLVDSLAALADDFDERGLTVELVPDELAEEPPEHVLQALCAATREALSNVAKHAGVTRAVVRVAATEGGWRVVVRDQGAGFEPAAAPRGYGLQHSIVERLAEVGGGSRVVSSPGRGTRVEMWAPA